MDRLEKAKLNPSAIYQHPRDILLDNSLTKAQKIDILKRWEYDEKEIQVAKEENMNPQVESKDSLLDAILAALRELNGEEDGGRHTSTKHG